MTKRRRDEFGAIDRCNNVVGGRYRGNARNGIDKFHEDLSVDDEQRSREADIDAVRAKVAALTPRETEVFERVTAGQANKVIAIELGTANAP